MFLFFSFFDISKTEREQELGDEVVLVARKLSVIYCISNYLLLATRNQKIDQFLS